MSMACRCSGRRATNSVNVYSKAPADERGKVYNLLEPIYPTEQEKPERIREGAEQQ